MVVKTIVVRISGSWVQFPQLAFSFGSSVMVALDNLDVTVRVRILLSELKFSIVIYMICKTCRKEFFEDWRKDSQTRKSPCEFCCRSCSNSRNRSKELRTQVAEKLRKRSIKYCSECGAIVSFNNKSLICKDCQIILREQYENGIINEKTLKFKHSKKSDGVKEHRRKVKKLLIEYKGGKCIICGYDKCDNALSFHHVDPTKKDFTIGKMRKYTYNFELIKKEVDKCVLVCTRCHIEIHANYINLSDYIDVSEYFSKEN